MIGFAIGYQGRSAENLCDELRRHRVELLIDVRERAWSNRPEFRKTALARKLNDAGIGYAHVKDAGNPFRHRGGTVVSREECLRAYQSYLASSPDVLPALRQLMKARAALFCYESHTINCHRIVLIRELVRAYPAIRVISIEHKIVQ